MGNQTRQKDVQLKWNGTEEVWEPTGIAIPLGLGLVRNIRGTNRIVFGAPGSAAGSPYAPR
jgi:hypothetical protein